MSSPLGFSTRSDADWRLLALCTSFLRKGFDMKHLILLASVLLAMAFLNAPVRADDKDANRPADQQAAQDNGSLDSHDAGFVRGLHQGNLTEIKTAELAKKQGAS